MNHYLNVFFESIGAASIVPIFSDASFYAMVSFGGFNLPLACALAVTGATVGQLINWFLGKLLFKLKTDNQVKISEYWYNRVSFLFNKYGIFLLLFSWVPLCNLFVVMSGLLNIRLKIVLPLVIAGQIFHYGQYLL